MLGESLLLSEKIAYVTLYYLVVANIFSFANFAIDKHKAINQQYRIPEKRLFFTAWLGGGIGAVIAMKFLRHKTLKNKFRYGIPAITIITYSGLIVLQGVLHDEVVPYVSSLFDKADGGGLLFLLLYPFLADIGEFGLSIYWSSVWTIIAIIWGLSFTYLILSKKISTLYRILLLFFNAYALIWMGFECVIGVLNSDSSLKAIILLSLPFTIGFTRDFVKGFSKGVSNEVRNEKQKKTFSQSFNRGLPIGKLEDIRISEITELEDASEPMINMPKDLINDLTKYGLIPTGPIRLVNNNEPIQDDEKVHFPLFGVSFYQRDHFPKVCEIELNKLFYKAGIDVGYEFMYVKDITNQREMEITNLRDLTDVYNDRSIGDELVFQVLVGRNTPNERIQSIYLKIENHISLVK